MRKILIFLFLISCNSGTESIKTYSNYDSDSIIEKSYADIMISDTITKKSDLVTKKKVEKIVKEINYLTNTVEILKTEKLLLTKELQISKQNVRIDTVYIETKKNFWGKEKTSVSTKTETKETFDSSIIEKQVIDTTKNQ